MLFGDEVARLGQRLKLDGSNATLVSPHAPATLGVAARRLLAGRTVRLFVVGGSAAAGAGGIGVNRTLDARLAEKMNAALSQAETSTGRSFGRVVRTSVAQGGTTSFWAALMAETLYGRQPHLLVWEYSINDHAVSLEAASRAGLSKDAGRTFGAETMRYLLDYWLRRTLTLGSPPPALLLAYLWDKQPAAAFKAGNRAYCRRMPVPGSAFAAQRPVLDQFASAGAGLVALNMARYVTERRYGNFCPLVADSYFHPSDEGHELIADLLTLTLMRLLDEGATMHRADLGAKRRGGGKGGGGKGGGKGGGSEVSVLAGGGDGGDREGGGLVDLPPARRLPRSSPAAVASTPDRVSGRLDELFASERTSPAVLLAWDPKWHPDDVARLSGRPHFDTRAPRPATRLFAKTVKERADRKWMWLVPPCKRDNSSALTVYVPSSSADGAAAGQGPRSLRALSYFGMESPGAKLRHTINGRPVHFEAARDSFLAQSWGYLQMWHLFDESSEPATVEPSGAIPSPRAAAGAHGANRGGRWRAGGGGNQAAAEHEWRLCAEHVPNARCIGFRCGLEFKMPMRTAAVGWFVALHA